MCFWQDTPDGEGNDEPLDQAQETYARLGACSARWVDAVRKPTAIEAPTSGWTTIAEKRRAAREELPARIERAFCAVQRDGGVSLHQMDVLDGYGDPVALARAEAMDPEQHWQDVGEEKLTSPRIGQSLVFLDAKGYRFYVPAYMRLVVRALGGAAPCAHGLWFSLRGDAYHQQHHYTLLSDEQRRTIAHFLVVMQARGDQDARRDARECLASYWVDRDSNGPRRQACLLRPHIITARNGCSVHARSTTPPSLSWRRLARNVRGQVAPGRHGARPQVNACAR